MAAFLKRDLIWRGEDVIRGRMKAAMRAAICLCIALLHARGDLVVVQKAENGDGGAVLKSTMKIKGDKARTDTVPDADPNAGMSTILDLASGDRITLDHKLRQFTRRSAAGADGGREAAPAAPPQPRDTGKKEKVGEYEAEIYTTETPDAKFTYWITKDYPDGAAVNGEMKKIRIMDKKRYHSPDLTKLEGVVVKSEVTLKSGPDPGHSMVVTLISAKIQPVDDSEFRVPGEYLEVRIPAAEGAKAQTGN